MCFSDPGSVLSKLKKLSPPQCDVTYTKLVLHRKTLHIRGFYKLIIDFN